LYGYFWIERNFALPTIHNDVEDERQRTVRNIASQTCANTVWPSKHILCGTYYLIDRTNHPKLADIPFKDFFLVTWLGLLPLQILYTYFGATLRNLSEIASGEVELDHMQKLSLVLQVVVIIALVAYFVYLSRKMKRLQEEKLKSERETNVSSHMELQALAQV
jgi:hypothetical protein